ncbi:MAG: hypothetical protein EXR67_05655 [Dehalococcoidia bacterium]|nr:hypothetical protein [Dehalococcoidia bacterium]
MTMNDEELQDAIVTQCQRFGERPFRLDDMVREVNITLRRNNSLPALHDYQRQAQAVKAKLDGMVASGLLTKKNVGGAETYSS